MLMHAKVLQVRDFSITTKRGDQLAKSRVKLVDLGDETDGSLPTYWVDFLGDAALSQTEREQVMRREFNVEIRHISASLGKNGKVYMNASGGALLDEHDVPVQVKLRQVKSKSA